MTSSPSASVVIPTYQRSASLSRTLDALSRCAAPPGGFEVIVVDDGSTDDTCGVVHQASIPVRYLRQDNAGPASARNRGWRAARAPIVIFTDDDTVPSPGWVLELLAEFCSRPDLGGVGGHVEPLRRGFVQDFVQAERLVRHGLARDGTVRYLVTANAAFRREALEENAGFDESFPRAAGEDVDLSMRLLEAGWKLSNIDSAVVQHDHPSRLGTVFRTYRRHGTARLLLADRHAGASPTGAVARVLGPRAWRARYRSYVAEGNPRAKALAFLLVRFAGLLFYLVGVIEGRSGSRPEPGLT